MLVGKEGYDLTRICSCPALRPTFRTLGTKKAPPEGGATPKKPCGCSVPEEGLEPPTRGL
jgi:hypothetical protein